MKQWSASIFLLICLLGVAAMAWAIGVFGGAAGFSERLARGAVWVGLHVTVSVAAGCVAGWVLGPGVAVGGHLGLYNLGSPVAVGLRVGWLRRNRPRFLEAGWFPLFVGLWVVGMGLGVFLIKWAQRVAAG